LLFLNEIVKLARSDSIGCFNWDWSVDKERTWRW